MSVVKQGLDYSDFQTAFQANKLKSNSIRKTFEYDRYAGKNSFVALVLTKPISFTARDVAIEVGAPAPAAKDESKESVGSKSTDSKIGKMGFRARIIGPDSPHTFIPNPCDSLEFTKATLGDNYNDTRNKLVAMHTMFYTENDFSTNPGHALPSEGDYVEVFLTKGAHSFNLQKGIFKGTIINKNDVKQTLANLNVSFAKFGGSAKSAYKKDPIKTGPTPLAILGKTAFPLQKGAPWHGLKGALGVGKVNSNWGPPGSIRALKKRRHCGTDFRANVGQPVYAVADGTVVHADWNAGLGREITIKHKENTYAADPSKNVYSRYAHLKGFSVKNGSSVKAGQLIGHSGDSFSGKEGIPAKKGGMSPHLHLELWVGGYGGDCGIPNEYPDGPTSKFTIDFMVWLAEQQAAANMPGAMVNHTLQEGTESAPAASIGVESDAEAGNLEDATFGDALEEYEDEEAFREFADDLDTGGPGAYVVDDSELMASLDEIEEDVDYMPEGTLGSDYGSWGLDVEDYDGSSDGWATD